MLYNVFNNTSIRRDFPVFCVYTANICIMKEFHFAPLERRFTLHVLKKKRKANLTLMTIIDNCIQGNIRLVLLCPFCPRCQQAKSRRVNFLKYIS